MDISNKPLALRPVASGHAEADPADDASAEPASSCRPDEQPDRSPPPAPTIHISESSPSSSSNPQSSVAGPLPEGSSRVPRTSFPTSIPLISFQRSKNPSAALAPSTAEGRPVPLTNADAHHTSALQKLNSKYPSTVRRHGYTPEAPGAQSSTYSQPVLVRTYSGPPPSQGSRSTRSRQYRPPSSSRGVSRRVPLPSSTTTGSGSFPGQPIQPTVSDVGVGTTSSTEPTLETDGSNAYGVSMPRPYKAKKATSSSGGNSSKLPFPWPWSSSRHGPEEPKLPPLEAFSFKSFMADLQARGGDNDISTDLDRIAEICARSRYSLSNQYEVHVAPHGSGAAFMSGVPSSAPRRRKGHSHSRSRSHGGQGVGGGGPTLQAITSDDEASVRSGQRRRHTGRRKSVAYGTLETIMSSSRSSEEEKSKKKSASELVGEVRGRAARKAWDNNNPSGSGSGSGSASASASTGNGNDGSTESDPQASSGQGKGGGETGAEANNRLARKKSASFATAIMDSSRSSGKTATSTASSSRRQKPASTTTASDLRSEPARPQTSGSHLGVKTAPEGGDSRPRSAGHHAGVHLTAHPPHQGSTAASGWGSWIPWRSAQEHHHPGTPGNAEGSLRQLLRAASDGHRERGK
ncbi:hypothetical protein VTI74DRAFT_1984 [Chaetomium olivicolor]